mmetsp:Transcript_26817/g.71426  ORF Transcript_26817/g.71426 Transcript_26817/m.71426 type:complete len:201 (+) Transcript_26817:3-605(+)
MAHTICTGTRRATICRGASACPLSWPGPPLGDRFDHFAGPSWRAAATARRVCRPTRAASRPWRYPARSRVCPNRSSPNLWTPNLSSPNSSFPSHQSWACPAKTGCQIYLEHPLASLWTPNRSSPNSSFPNLYYWSCLAKTVCQVHLEHHLGSLASQSRSQNQPRRQSRSNLCSTTASRSTPKRRHPSRCRFRHRRRSADP